MIRLADVVTRIRTECPDFNTVEHALTSAGQDVYPVALVSPVKIEPPRRKELLGPIGQRLDIVVGVFVILDREADPAPDYRLANKWDDLVEQVRAAMIGWLAPGADFPFDYAGGELDRYKGDGPVAWRDDFVTTAEDRRQ